MIKYIYLLVSFFFGIILWFYWQGNLLNYSRKAADVDSKVKAVLFEGGISDIDIAGQSAREKNKLMAGWIEFEKEIELKESVDYSGLKNRLKQLADSENIEYVNAKLSPGRETVKLGLKDKIFSRLIFVLPAPKTAEKPAGRVAIVIDDVGVKENISGFLDLGIPITFAVMPGERHSKKTAALLEEKKYPFILHLPMEPEKYPAVNPGAYAVLLKMTDDEIVKMFLKDLAMVPGAAGVSNHMGSAFSADESKMKTLLAAVKSKNLFYFDSHTTPKSKARKAAKELGLSCEVNELFLDVEDTPEFMDRQFELMLKNVKKQGSFIAIGHCHKNNMVPELKKYIPVFEKEKIKFVYLTEFIAAGRK